MNKTTSIHIQGFPFIIEEIAYTRLENYIKRLKSALAGQEGADEIIEDIELRIAELFTSKTSSTKQVIDDNDVIDVLNTLGDPKEYADNPEDAHVSTEETYSNSQQTYERRLYRDTENGYIGGVCSGLASYFNIDPTIIRLIWAAALLIGGVGFLLYVVLWIVIPKASSSIDRLKMKGKPINVDSVREEVERTAKNVSEKSRQFANQVKSDVRVNKGFQSIRKIVRIAFGLFLLFCGSIFFITTIGIFFGTPQTIPSASTSGFTSIFDLSKLLFNEPFDNNLAWIAGGLCAFSITLFFLLGGFVNLFNIKNKWYRYTNFTLIFIGIIGFTLGIIVAARTANDFTSPVELEKEILTSNSLEIVTTANESSNTEYKVKRKNNMNLYIKNNVIYNYGIPVRYQESKDSLIHVVLRKKANGQSPEYAERRAKNILFDYRINSDTITIPTYFSYPTSDKFRNQDVRLIIYVPKNKQISIDGKLVDLSTDNDDDDDYYKDEYDSQRGLIRSDGSYHHWD